MFETTSLNRVGGHVFSFLAALAQAIFVPIASFLFTLPVGVMLESSGEYPGETHHPFARVAMPPITLLAGYLLGRCSRRALPALAHQGRWAWILSTLFFVLGLLLAFGHDGFLTGFVSMFDVEGKEDIAVWLVSLPTFFSVGYSLGCFVPKTREGIA
jgi:hypothetical protein